MSELQQQQLASGEAEKRNNLEKERETAVAVRNRAMERMGKTRERECTEKEAKRKKIGVEAVGYLKDRKEQESKVKEEEIKLRKGEFDMKKGCKKKK